MSGKRRDDNVKQSTICNACRGTGTETRPRARRVTGPDGKTTTVTDQHEETCRVCNGYGEYPMVGGR